MTCQLFLLLSIAINAPEFPVDQEHRLITRFDSADAAAPWRTVNDGVMGGRSTGQFRINENRNLEFFGALSLQNNGGFASVRARVQGMGLTEGDSVVLRVRGDGREYNFNLYTQSDLGGYSYRQSFQTRAGEWVEVAMPVERFVATWRGRTFPDQKLDPRMVAGMGILLGDKQPGPFRLEVEWIKVASGQ